MLSVNHCPISNYLYSLLVLVMLAMSGFQLHLYNNLHLMWWSLFYLVQLLKNDPRVVQSQKCYDKNKNDVCICLKQLLYNACIILKNILQRNIPSSKSIDWFVFMVCQCFCRL